MLLKTRTLILLLLLMALAPWTQGQNAMSGKLNDTANSFKNSGMPQQFSKQYEALANIRDPGFSGGQTYPLDAQMMQQALQSLGEAQRRIDEINERAEQQMRRDSQQLRRAGDQSANNINNQAVQGLKNLDAIDRAESKGPTRKIKSDRPDVEFGNYVQGRDKIIKYIGNTPLYDLEGANEPDETPTDQLLKEALDPQPLGAPYTFQSGTSTADLPNSYVAPIDGQMAVISKGGSTQPLGNLDAPPTGGAYTRSLEEALSGKKGYWTDLNYSSRSQAIQEYARMKNVLNHQDMFWQSPYRNQLTNHISKLKTQIEQLKADRASILSPTTSRNPSETTFPKLRASVDAATDYISGMILRGAGVQEKNEAVLDAVENDLNQLLRQSKSKLDTLTQKTGEALHEYKTKVDAIEKADPEATKRAQSLPGGGLPTRP